MRETRTRGAITSTLRGLLAGVTLLSLLVGGAFAQDEDAPAAQGPRYDSPRAVMEAFLGGASTGDYDGAATAFEESDPGYPVPPTTVGKLYDVLNKTELVELGDLPGRGEARDEYLYQRSPPGSPELNVVIRFVDGEKGWRITKGTRENVAELHAAMADVPYVEDFLGSLSGLEWLHYQAESQLPEVLTQRGFILENWQWLGLLLLVFVAVVFDRLVRFLVGRFAVRLVKERDVRLDAETLVSFERPMGMLAAVLGFELLLPALGLDGGVLELLLLATSFFATVAGVWATYRLVDVFCDYLAERASRTSNKFDDMLVPLLRRTLKLFVLVVGIVFIASRLSEDLWSVVAGLGLGSIAVGFAARDSIENLFGTFTVLMDKPFQIGDWIIVGDLEGTVEQVGFRSTRIRTFYNSILQVPNRTFISSSVDNMGERRYRRIKTMLSLTYDTPPEKIEAFCEGIREIIRKHPYTRKDYYHVYLNAFAAASLDVLLYAFVETPDWSTELREKHRLFADILRLAEKLEVDFAFPTQTIHVAKPEDLEHPNRPDSDQGGADWGRSVADEVVEKSLSPFGGEKPPPVVIETGPEDRARRFGDDGEDGG